MSDFEDMLLLKKALSCLADTKRAFLLTS